MWIEKRKDNFRLYERYTDAYGKTHKVSVSMPRDTPQCRNKAKQKIDALIEKKSAFYSCDLTFENLTKFYLIQKAPELKASTNRRNERECATLNKLFGKVNVDEMTASLVKTRIMNKSTNPTTVNEHIQRFKEIIKWGYQNDFVENPSFIDKIKPLKNVSRREKVKDKFLEREECEKLAEGMTESGKNMTWFLILSGLRIGEALALNEDDIDLDNKIISVTKTLDPVTKEITPPKTFTSNRQVDMSKDLLTLCKAIRAFNAKQPKAVKVNRKPAFWNEAGTPMDYYGYNKYLKTMSKKNLGRAITPHVLRHTHASILAASGVEYPLISRRLGHENSKITLEIYIHVTNEVRKKDKKVMNEITLFDNAPVGANLEE